MTFGSRKLHDGSRAYFARWRENGRQRRHTFRGVHDRAMALALFERLRAQHVLRNADLPADPNLNLSAALRAYRADRAVRCTERYARGLRSDERALCAFLGASRPIAGLTHEDIDRLILEMRGRGLSPRTINGRLGVLRGAAALAAKRRLIARNPLADVERVSDPRPRAWRRMADDEIMAVLAVLQHGGTDRVASRAGNEYEIVIPPARGMFPLVMFLLHTGARLSEAQRLRWDDVDFRAGHVVLNTTKRARDGRATVTRNVPMNDTLKSMLAGLVRNGPSVFLLRYNVRRKWVRALDLAGVRRYRVHDLRHTFASTLADAGAPPFTLKEIMGHTSLQTTLRYYHAGGEQTAKATAACAHFVPAPNPKT